MVGWSGRRTPTPALLKSLRLVPISEHEESSSLLSLEGFYGSWFAAPLDGAAGGRCPGRHRCRPAGLYASHLQLHGVGAGAYRHRRLRLRPIRVLPAAGAHAADLGGHAGPDWPRDVA